ncbi:hypothetical protein B7463_g3548, partial [Scytalidium lignicola]
MLCTNRPEGFGPSSKLSSPLPTTCFVDTILIPLPTWLSLALLFILLFSTAIYRSRDYDPSTAHLRASHLRQRSCLLITTTILYYVLIICNILMVTLEIVRLSLIHFGITLLPFAYVGLILVLLLHWSEGLFGRVRGWMKVNLVILVGGVAVSVVKIVGLVKEGIHGRKGSKYPISDQVIDVGVMAGVYAIIALMEIGLAVVNARRRRNLARDGDQLVFGAGRFWGKYPASA